ncbi:hypothetical protein LFT44_21780 (plasmid) [Arthrobacter sp. FW306-05-C]|uniref:hypothetical protein n=1 Tax=Arthrobacter sp. FW306-05-C TaxID=2879620 RepID=UPI001F19CD43|nr:hypothetical protein [Arthrobacter sp. FW306-05-C]UKA69151.1 hypothetical protein LFT44_21780 [Arthrobacter sp. FW306-05-C]
MSDPRYAARSLIELNIISLEGVWLRYWGQGGSAGALDFDAFLYEIQEPPQLELAFLAWAMDDLEADSPH